jgi:hypothetical protein
MTSALTSPPSPGFLIAVAAMGWLYMLAGIWRLLLHVGRQLRGWGKEGDSPGFGQGRGALRSGFKQRGREMRAILAVATIAMLASPAFAQTTYVRPTPNGGAIITTPGAPTTFVNPTPNGGFIANTPGRGTTYGNPTPGGGYIISHPTPGGALGGR